MDGKGEWRESVFVERIWKSIKYEKICLLTYASVGKARRKIGCYLELDNSRRPHSGVRAQTPDQVYSHCPPEVLAAERAMKQALEMPVLWKARNTIELFPALPARR